MTQIIEMVFGSHLYGTDTPSSDRDYKAVYIPSARDIALQKVNDVIVTQTRTDNALGVRNGADDVDTETFALHKYLKLLAQGQTVALDMLFCPRDKMIGTPDYIWEGIFENRHKVISRKADSFIGYCRQQANKYGIKGSRMNECEIVMTFFSERLNKPLAKVIEHQEELKQLVIGMEHTNIIDISNPNGVVVEHLECCQRKCPFTVTVKEAYKIYAGLFDRYGERTKLAKTNEGIDWKAMSHAVRVGEQAIELLTTGFVTFPRPNAEYLKDIKTGKLPFVEVGAYIEQLFVEVEQASVASTLPAEADQQFIDDLVFNVYGCEVALHFA